MARQVFEFFDGWTWIDDLILVRPVHKSVVTLSRSTDGEKEDTGEEKHPQPRI